MCKGRKRTFHLGYRKSILPHTLWVILIGLALFGCQGTLNSLRDSSEDATLADKGKEEQRKELVQKLYRLQMPFIANEGQIRDEHVRFYSQTFAGTVYVTKEGEIVYSQPCSPNPQSEILHPVESRLRRVRNAEFHGASPKSQVSILKETLAGTSISTPQGIDRARTKVNYFIGDDKSKWRTNVTTYNSVSLGAVYKGIDLSLKAHGKTVEKIFTVQPGADPKTIKLKLEGAESLQINDRGELEVETDLGAVRFSKPLAYQEKNGIREAVKVAYRLHGHNYGFKVDDYDKSFPLVIDPALSWNTFMGSASDDSGNSIAVDASGNVYVAGSSGATWGSPVDGHSGGNDAFVAQLNSSGTMLWNTFMGSTSSDSGESIAVDASGNVYVSGRSGATWGSPENAYAGGGDAFAAKLDSSGGLTWHTFMGSSSDEYGASIAVDGSGNVYVAGYSTATWGSPENAHAGDYDGFAAKLDSSGGRTWNTFMGGDSYDHVSSIAVDGSGNVYVSGSSAASWGSPVNAYAGTDPDDAFAAKLDSSGGRTWNTFMGSTSVDAGMSIAVDGSGNVYVAGRSDAGWGSPVDGHSGDYDAFAVKLDNSGGRTWNTFMGSASYDAGFSIAVDGSGNVYVAGNSDAGWDSPVDGHSGGNDAFAAKLDSSGALLWNTFLGGAGTDYGYSLAVDGSENVYVAGYSDATWGSTVDPYAGGGDAFVAKLSPQVWYVDGDVPESGDGTTWGTAFKTIEEAIDAASAGDEILVAAGTYNENVTLKPGVLLYGTGPDVTIIAGNATSAGGFPAVTMAEGSHISGFRVTGGYVGIDSQDVTADIINNVVTGNYGTGISLVADAAGSEVSSRVINNTIADNLASDYGQSDGIYIEDQGADTIANPIVINNIVTGQDFGISPYDGSGDLLSPEIIYNNVWGNSTANYGYGYTPGTGEISEDPLYADSYYHLSSGSPCIDAGDNSAVPAGITTDFEGEPRFFDDIFTADTGSGTPPIVDMGADEYVDTDSDGLSDVDEINIYGTDPLNEYTPTGDLPDIDRAALIDIYLSTDGASWTSNTNWLGTPGTECDSGNPWFGVSCGGGLVVGLDLQDNNLVGSIPSSIGNFTELHRLFLSRNQLSGSIPSSLGNLTSLENLWLHENQLSGSIPDLSGLTNLLGLYLYDNQLTGSIPDLSSLTSLVGLYLFANQLSGPIPYLSSLTSLQWLYLYDNQLSGPIPDLSSLTNLLHLYLQDNQLSGTIPDLSSLASLENLNLSGNQLSGPIPTALKDLTLVEDGSDFRWNALYAEPGDPYYSDLIDLLTYAQVGDDWASTQTVAPTDLAIDPASITDTSVTLTWSTIPYTDDTGGYEIWQGTPGETLLVKDINPGSAYSDPNNLIEMGGTLYFVADDGIHGEELWKSDGAAAGTVLVKDIKPGLDASSIDYLTDVGGTLYFAADDGTHGSELWKSDGTAAGTVLVKDINPGSGSSGLRYLTGVGGTLYFRASDGSNGYELWKSDGTAGGTVLVKDINPGSGSGSPFSLIDAGGTLYFQANDGVNGAELWKSDGTAGGTVLVKDINAGSGSSHPTYLIDAGGTLYFIANDGVNGAELWKSDGTPAGTMMVKDIYPSSISSNPSYLTNVGGILYFEADDAVNGRELWKSDGTEAGTVMVKDINPGSGFSSPRYLIEVGGILYFEANDGVHSNELWKSDGTAAGTVMVKDINPGSGSSQPYSLTDVGGILYLRANDGVHGNELWKSDGTEAGTVMVKDIFPGSISSYPYSLTEVGGTLYFQADDGVDGAELWTSGTTWILRDTTANKTTNNFTVDGLTVGIDYTFRLRTVTEPHAKNQNQVHSEFTPAVPATTTLESTFDTGLEGWTTVGGASGFTHVETGGNPGGYMESGDGLLGSDLYFVAPSTWSGDWSAYINGTLQYDLIRISGIGYYGNVPDVIIYGDSDSISWTAPERPTGTWQRLQLQLTPEVFGTDAATFQSVMSNVTEVRIRGDYVPNSTAEVHGLDNIIVSVADSDGDGMHDSWEIKHFGDLSHDGLSHSDSDTLTDFEEFLAGTDPTLDDTDADGTLDDVDNCPVVANSDQAETDGDGIGDLCDDLLAYYQFERNPLDSSGNHNHGAAVNGLTYEVEGLSQSSSFDNINDRIKIPESIISGTDVTVNVWFKTSNPEFGVISGANTTFTNEFLLFNRPGQFETYYHQPSPSTNRSETSINLYDNLWHMLTVVTRVDGTEIYLDGQLIDAVAYGSQSAFNVEGLWIGTDQDCVNGCWQDIESFGGLMDEFRIYSRALNADEVLGIYTNADGDGDGMADFWEFNHFGDTTSHDNTTDEDSDGLLDADEFISRTDPNDDDTDDDGLLDGVETNTGVFVSPDDTGTDPNDEDTDDDGLLDGVESNTGAFVDQNDTGTNPLNPDSDGDWINDGDEVNDYFTNPVNSNDYPATVRVSVSSAGAQSNQTSQHPSTSAGGRYVAFSSGATNLVPNDTNNEWDVFVFDRETGTVERVSVDKDGNQGTDWSLHPSISADGRYTAFRSDASNLVPDDTNSAPDVFVFDRQDRSIVRVSVDSDGNQGSYDHDNYMPSISADGRHVAFYSEANNLVSDDTNGTYDVFVHDRDTDGDGIFDEPGWVSTTRVSVDSNGVQGNNWSERPSISGDGRYVAFSSIASNLLGPGTCPDPNLDCNDTRDVFVHDRDTDEDGIFDEPGWISTTRVSVASDGSEGNGSTSEKPSISADGRHVAFHSYASNLVAGDNNGAVDVFVHDMQTGATKRVSVASDGSESDGGYSGWPLSISGDGRYVTFDSPASNLVPNDTNGTFDVFVHDRDTDGDAIFDEPGVGAISTILVSVNGAGIQGNTYSYEQSISSDGGYVAFRSSADNLVPNDTNGRDDIFVRDLRSADSDGDGMPDNWEYAHGLNPNDPSDAGLDPDEDGLSNLSEFQQNRNPNSLDGDSPVGSISGHVFESDGSTPITVTIEVVVFSGDPCGGHHWVKSVWTHPSDGSFTIADLNPGTYYLETRNGGANYVNVFWDGSEGSPDCNAATAETVNAAQSTSGIDFSLYGGGFISGRVLTDSLPQEGIEGVLVDAFDYDTGLWMGNGVTQTDGSYTIPGLSSRRYRVKTCAGCSGLNWIDEYFNDTYFYYQATAVQVTAPAPTEDIDFGLSIGGSISGTVYESDGSTPIENVHVYAVDFDTGEWMGGGHTNAAGIYTIPGLPSGRYRVQACASCSGLNFIDEFFDDAYMYDQATAVPVTAPDPYPEPVNFALVGMAARPTVQAAVADGLAWLAVEQNPDGSWGNKYALAKTGLAVLNFVTDARAQGLSPFDAAYLYNQEVLDGLNYIFSNAFTTARIRPQAAGNPDGDSDGLAVYFDLPEPDHHSIENYNTSIAMMAIAATDSPARVVDVPGSPVHGWAYVEVLQDAVDYLAWGQTDSAEGRGGWNYQPMDRSEDWGWSDQSNSGWVTMALAYAESLGISTPGFVRTELNRWIDFIQNDVDGDPDDGGSHYSDPYEPYDPMVNILKTGNLLQQMAYVGDTEVSQRVQDAVDYLVRHWNEPYEPGWIGNPSCYQATYSAMKGLSSLGIIEIDSTDWFQDFQDEVLPEQTVEGWWPVTCFDEGERLLSTTWALLTLQKAFVTTVEKPDLVISDISVVWLDSDIGIYSVSGTVKNAGNTVVPAGYRVGPSVDGTAASDFTMNTDLAPGETVVVPTWNFLLSGETDEITMCADINGDVDELNEENNCLSKITPTLISGTITSSELGTGNLIIWGSTDPTFATYQLLTPTFTPSAADQMDYELRDLPLARYYLYFFIDANGNDTIDLGEPFAYQGYQPDTLDILYNQQTILDLQEDPVIPGVNVTLKPATLAPEYMIVYHGTWPSTEYLVVGYSPYAPFTLISSVTVTGDSLVAPVNITDSGGSDTWYEYSHFIPPDAFVGGAIPKDGAEQTYTISVVPTEGDPASFDRALIIEPINLVTHTHEEDFEDNQIDPQWWVVGDYEITDGKFHMRGMDTGLNNSWVSLQRWNEFIHQFEADIEVPSPADVPTSQNQIVGIEVQWSQDLDGSWVSYQASLKFNTEVGQFQAGLGKDSPAGSETLGLEFIGPGSFSTLYALSITIKSDTIVFGINGQETELFDGLFTYPDSVTTSEVLVHGHTAYTDVDYYADNLKAYSQGVATLMEPVEGAVVGTTPTFVWEPVAGAGRYRVDIVDQNGNWILLDYVTNDPGISEYSYTLADGILTVEVNDYRGRLTVVNTSDGPYTNRSSGEWHNFQVAASAGLLLDATYRFRTLEDNLSRDDLSNVTAHNRYGFWGFWGEGPTLKITSPEIQFTPGRAMENVFINNTYEDSSVHEDYIPPTTVQDANTSAAYYEWTGLPDFDTNTSIDYGLMAFESQPSDKDIPADVSRSVDVDSGSAAWTQWVTLEVTIHDPKIFQINLDIYGYNRPLAEVQAEGSQGLDENDNPLEWESSWNYVQGKLYRRTVNDPLVGHTYAYKKALRITPRNHNGNAVTHVPRTRVRLRTYDHDYEYSVEAGNTLVLTDSSGSGIGELRITPANPVKWNPDRISKQIRLEVLQEHFLQEANGARPTIESRTPTPNSGGVSVDTDIEVRFSEPMDPETLEFTLEDRWGNVISEYHRGLEGGTSSWSDNDQMLTFTLPVTEPLKPGTAYRVSVFAKDAAGTSMLYEPGTNSWVFTTQPAGVDDIAPQVISTLPIAGPVLSVVRTTPARVEESLFIAAQFSEAILFESLEEHVELARWDSGGGSWTPWPFTLVYSGIGVSIVPTGQLLDNARYRVTLKGDIKDLSGNALGSDYSWEFETGPADTTGPTLSAPVIDGAADVNVWGPALFFYPSEELDRATLTADNITIEDSTGEDITQYFDIYYRKPSRGLQLRKNAAARFLRLKYHETYTVTFTDGIRDLSGNPLQGAPRVFSFTTVPSNGNHRPDLYRIPDEGLPPYPFIYTLHADGVPVPLVVLDVELRANDNDQWWPGETLNTTLTIDGLTRSLNDLGNQSDWQYVTSDPPAEPFASGAGTYPLTLTVTDSVDHQVSLSHPVVIFNQLNQLPQLVAPGDGQEVALPVILSWSPVSGTCDTNPFCNASNVCEGGGPFDGDGCVVDQDCYFCAAGGALDDKHCAVDVDCTLVEVYGVEIYESTDPDADVIGQFLIPDDGRSGNYSLTLPEDMPLQTGGSHSWLVAGFASVSDSLAPWGSALSARHSFTISTTDTDGDGVPDVIDPDDDNDGWTDLQESQAGTDPLSDTDYPVLIAIYVDPFGEDANLGDATHPLQSLQAAAETLNRLPELPAGAAYDIYLAPGIYTDEAAVVLQKSVRIIGSGSGVTILQGDLAWTTGLVMNVGSSPTFTISALTMQGFDKGLVITTDGGCVNMDDVVITSCTTGIAVVDSYQLTLSLGDAVIGQCTTAIDVVGGSHLVIQDGTVELNSEGITVEADYTHIERMQVSENDHGIVLQDGIHNQVTDCVIHDNNISGISVYTCCASINFNNFSGNHCWAVFSDEPSTGDIPDATYNYWGCDASGPFNVNTNEMGIGDPVSDGVKYRPWLGETGDSTSDNDNDGWTALQESQAETDPNDPEDYPVLTAIYVDPLGEDANLGDQAHPLQSVQAAAEMLSRLPELPAGVAYDIYLGPGTYTGEATAVLQKSVRIIGSGRGITILEGSPEWTTGLMMNVGSSPIFTIRDLTMRYFDKALVLTTDGGCVDMQDVTIYACDTGIAVVDSYQLTLSLSGSLIRECDTAIDVVGGSHLVIQDGMLEQNVEGITVEADYTHIERMEILNNDHGIILQDGIHNQVTECLIHDNNISGISVYTCCTSINFNDFSGNHCWAVFSDEPSTADIVDARNNYWGCDDSGPFNVNTNEMGIGDPVSDGVKYRPWEGESGDSTSDNDNDGWTSIQELQAGTDPNDSEDFPVLTAIYVDPLGEDANLGDEAHPLQSIQAAAETLNRLPELAEGVAYDIYLAPGTYTGEATAVLQKSARIIGSGMGVTILEGSAAWTTGLMMTVGSSPIFTIRDLTMRYFDKALLLTTDGGCVNVEDVTIYSCTTGIAVVDSYQLTLSLAGSVISECDTAIKVAGGSHLVIQDGMLEQNLEAITVEADYTHIRTMQILENDHGVVLQDGIHNQVTDCLIHENNVSGVSVYTCCALINFNSFYGNHCWAVFSDEPSTGDIPDATYNYWGCDDVDGVPFNGPFNVNTNEMGIGDPVSDGVEYRPWLGGPPTPGDGDNDGLPDQWEIDHFGSIDAQDGDGDPDEDGVINRDEYVGGSNPNNPVSVAINELISTVYTDGDEIYIDGTSKNATSITVTNNGVKVSPINFILSTGVWECVTVNLVTGVNAVVVTAHGDQTTETALLEIIRDRADPTVSIDDPTSDTTQYSYDSIELTGQFSDDTEIATGTWVLKVDDIPQADGTVSPTGPGGSWDTWIIPDIPLTRSDSDVDNVITVTAFDIFGKEGQASITITTDANTISQPAPPPVAPPPPDIDPFDLDGDLNHNDDETTCGSLPEDYASVPANYGTDYLGAPNEYPTDPMYLWFNEDRVIRDASGVIVGSYHWPDCLHPDRDLDSMYDREPTDCENLIINSDTTDTITSIADVLAGGDFDSDGKSNIAECLTRQDDQNDNDLDPTNPDTDGDGLNDGDDPNPTSALVSGFSLEVEDVSTNPVAFGSWLPTYGTTLKITATWMDTPTTAPASVKIILGHYDKEGELIIGSSSWAGRAINDPDPEFFTTQYPSWYWDSGWDKATRNRNGYFGYDFGLTAAPLSSLNQCNTLDCFDQEIEVGETVPGSGSYTFYLQSWDYGGSTGVLVRDFNETEPEAPPIYEDSIWVPYGSEKNGIGAAWDIDNDPSTVNPFDVTSLDANGDIDETTFVKSNKTDPSPGDKLNNLWEYRGVACVIDGQLTIVRLNPTRKNLFIRDVGFDDPAPNAVYPFSYGGTAPENAGFDVINVKQWRHDATEYGDFFVHYNKGTIDNVAGLEVTGTGTDWSTTWPGAEWEFKLVGDPESAWTPVASWKPNSLHLAFAYLGSSTSGNYEIRMPLPPINVVIVHLHPNLISPYGASNGSLIFYAAIRPGPGDSDGVSHWGWSGKAISIVRNKPDHYGLAIVLKTAHDNYFDQLPYKNSSTYTGDPVNPWVPPNPAELYLEPLNRREDVDDLGTLPPDDTKYGFWTKVKPGEISEYIEIMPENNTNGVWDGDYRLIDQADWGTRGVACPAGECGDLTPMDINSNGYVELPFATEPLADNGSRECAEYNASTKECKNPYDKAWVAGQSAGHEIFHALAGLQHSVDSEGAFYKRSINWKRGNYIGNWTRERAKVHNYHRYFEQGP